MELNIQNIYYVVGTIFMFLATLFILFGIIIAYKIQKLLKSIPDKTLSFILSIMKENRLKFGGIIGAVVSGFLARSINSFFRKRD
jgi:hypothetical protein